MRSRGSPSGREVVHGLIGAGIGLGGPRLVETTGAKKKRKKRKRGVTGWR